MACLFAARFLSAGIPVAMLGSWPEGKQALRCSGVRISEQDNREKCYPVQVLDQPSDCAGIPNALVLVKSWQTAYYAEQLRACLAPDGVALTLQNGAGNYETLSETLGAQRVALGSTTSGATLIGPGHVRPAGEGMIKLGVHPRLKPLTQALRTAGFVVETVSDTASILWGKLVINAAINPLTALLRVPNGELLERPSARIILADAAREAAAVATAKGIHLPYSDPVLAAEGTAASTAKNTSSMLQDVLRGAPTEIDAICGQIIRAGEEYTLPTPVNRTLHLLVKAIGE
jgi:2-dehydropantoate 2-reductase